MESMDKAGNFIGWLHIEGLNLSVALVEGALSKVHFTAERSAYYKTLVSAEDGCRQRKEKVRPIYMEDCDCGNYQRDECTPNSHKAVFIKLL